MSKSLPFETAEKPVSDSVPEHPKAELPKKAAPRSPYRIPFRSPKTVFVAMKPDRDASAQDGFRYYGNCFYCGGIGFPQKTQKPYAHEQEDGLWLRLSTPGDPGAFSLIRPKNMRKLLAKLPWRVLRVSRKRDGDFLRSEPYDLSCRVSVQNPNGRGTIEGPTYTRHKEDGDIPLAKFLVMLSEEELAKYGGRHNIRDLPSMLDIDPTLGVVPSQDEEEETGVW